MFNAKCPSQAGGRKWKQNAQGRHTLNTVSDEELNALQASGDAYDFGARSSVFSIPSADFATRETGAKKDV